MIPESIVFIYIYIYIYIYVILKKEIGPTTLLEKLQRKIICFFKNSNLPSLLKLIYYTASV